MDTCSLSRILTWLQAGKPQPSYNRTCPKVQGLSSFLLMLIFDDDPTDILTARIMIIAIVIYGYQWCCYCYHWLASLLVGIIIVIIVIIFCYYYYYCCCYCCYHYYSFTILNIFIILKIFIICIIPITFIILVIVVLPCLIFHRRFWPSVSASALPPAGSGSDPGRFSCQLRGLLGSFKGAFQFEGLL